MIDDDRDPEAPSSEPLPDKLLQMVLLTIGITLGLSAIAIWIVTHTG